MECTLTLDQINNVAEIDVVYKKKSACKASERPIIRSSQDSFEILKHYWNHDKIDLVEEFKVLFLNRKNAVLQFLPLSCGGYSGTVAEIRLLLAVALKIGSHSLIISHYAKYMLM